MFERLGAPAWEAQARAELDRVGLRRSPDELTATERRVAELAADRAHKPRGREQGVHEPEDRPGQPHARLPQARDRLARGAGRPNGRRTKAAHGTEVAERPIPPRSARPNVEPWFERERAGKQAAHSLGGARQRSAFSLAVALLAVGAGLGTPRGGVVDALGARAEDARTRADDSRRGRCPLSSPARPRTGRHRGELDRRRGVVHAPDAGSARDARPPGRQRHLLRDLPGARDVSVPSPPLRPPRSRPRSPPTGARARTSHLPRNVRRCRRRFAPHAAVHRVHRRARGARARGRSRSTCEGARRRSLARALRVARGSRRPGHPTSDLPVRRARADPEREGHVGGAASLGERRRTQRSTGGRGVVRPGVGLALLAGGGRTCPTPSPRAGKRIERISEAPTRPLRKATDGGGGCVSLSRESRVRAGSSRGSVSASDQPRKRKRPWFERTQSRRRRTWSSTTAPA